jgi:hypothetical protein
MPQLPPPPFETNAAGTFTSPFENSPESKDCIERQELDGHVIEILRGHSQGQMTLEMIYKAIKKRDAKYKMRNDWQV